MNAAHLRSAAAVAVLLIALVGCKADPVPGEAPVASGTPSASASGSASASPSGSPSSSPSVSATATASPTPTQTPATSVIALPGDCAAIYSPEMLATLQTSGQPLNDPGVDMAATNVEAAFAVLEQAAAAGQSLRCSWGVPSEVGLATQVSLVDDAQADTVLTSLHARGLNCAPYGAGTLCRIVVEPAAESDGHVWGETHFLAGNGWVATSWINFGPDGYTEDIVTTLWG